MAHLGSASSVKIPPQIDTILAFKMGVEQQLPLEYNRVCIHIEELNIV